MKTQRVLLFMAFVSCVTGIQAQIGTRFPSEKKTVIDSVTGTELVFLTSKSGTGDSKIYQTHNQWTADGKWVIFRSDRVRGEAMAVNEETGTIVQVSEGGFMGMLNVGRKNMKLYYMRYVAPEGEKDFRKWKMSVVEVDLEKLFKDSEAGTLKGKDAYERICGTPPDSIGAGGDMALDADETRVYFREGKEEAARHLPAGTKLEENFGPRNMGAGPSGIGCMDLRTGKVSHVISVPFQIGHIQTNPWVAGEIVFCWETGGKAPQRTWTVQADGSGLRPVYAEADYDWVTHEAVITKDEVAIAVLGHRPITTGGNYGSEVKDPLNPGQEPGWGKSGTREHATGLGIVNLRTREFTMAGQIATGSGFWHVNGSGDGKWAVGDNFAREIYLIDRRNSEMILLSAGHKTTARDHPHPTFSPDNTKIEIQSAMLSEDGKSLNICIIHIPDALLKR